MDWRNHKSISDCRADKADRNKKEMPGRKKKDDKDTDFIVINPTGDMICTCIFLAEIAALFWHAKVNFLSVTTQHAQVNLGSNRSWQHHCTLDNRNVRKMKARKTLFLLSCWAQSRWCLAYSRVKKLERRLPNGSLKLSSNQIPLPKNRCCWPSLATSSGSSWCMWCVNLTSLPPSTLLAQSTLSP